MKPSPVIIFVSRPEEVSSVEKILRKTPAVKPMVIASTPEASIKLLQRRFDFVDSDRFYPSPNQIKSWQNRLLKLCQTWHLYPKLRRRLTVNSVNLGKVCELGIHIYLGEIGHSILTAKNLLNKFRPKKIYVSGGFTETPYRRYQTESFTLEAAALKLMAEKLGIETIQFSRSHSLEPKILLILQQLISSLLFDIRSLFSPRQTLPPTDFIFIGNHYQLVNLLPTLTAARDKIKFWVTGKADSATASQVAAKKIPFTLFDQLMPFSSRLLDLLKFLATWFMFKPQLKKIFSSADPLIWQLIEPKLWWYFANEFTQMASTVKTARQLLSANPKALITMATSDHFSRAIALTAKTKKIPVIELQHGLYRIDVEYPFRSNTYFLVWSKKEREILFQGKSHPRLYPLAGYPWFDQYQNIQNELSKLRQSGKSHFGLKDNEHVILILATFPKDLDDDRLAVNESAVSYMQMVFAAIKKLPENWKVIFRPHPSCRSKWVKDLAKYNKISFIYDDRSVLLKQSLATADIVVANFTTAIVDAILMDKPVLLHTLLKMHKNSLKNFPSLKSQIVFYFETSQELTGLLLHSRQQRFKIDSRSKKYFLKNYIDPTGRPASEQIVEYLKTFTKER